MRNQAFGETTDERIKESIRQNATSSPLLRLPLELRQRIWEYVLGHQLIHISRDEYMRNNRCRWFHTVCESAITEPEAYELSKSEEYDKAVGGMKEGEDMRLCQNRHAVCYEALLPANKEHRPHNKLHIDLLGVCQQTYVEANSILWGTNTWSIYRYAWNDWHYLRTPDQKRLIKKVHFGTNVINCIFQPVSVLEYDSWKELYVDITVNCLEPTYINQFFPAEQTTVICSGTNNIYDGPVILAWNGGTTLKQRHLKAETHRSHLVRLGNEAKSRQEKMKQKRQNRLAQRLAQRRENPRTVVGEGRGAGLPGGPKKRRPKVKKGSMDKKQAYPKHGMMRRSQRSEGS